MLGVPKYERILNRFDTFFCIPQSGIEGLGNQEEPGMEADHGTQKGLFTLSAHCPHVERYGEIGQEINIATSDTSENVPSSSLFGNHAQV